MTFSTESDLSRVQDELDRWSGAYGLIRTLTVSHRALAIELWREGGDAELRIECIGPTYVAGHLRWRVAKLNVRRVATTTEASSDAIELVDAHNGMSVRCYIVRLKWMGPKPYRAKSDTGAQD